MRTETIQVIVSYHISYETPEAREDVIETVLRDGGRTSLRGAGQYGSYGWDRVSTKLVEEPTPRFNETQADIAFLAKRARLADAWSYRTARDTGISSNSIVSRAYGLRVKLELPADADDLAACERAVAKLPKHRRTARVMADLARARKAVKS